jgi:hypothetical protein
MAAVERRARVDNRKMIGPEEEAGIKAMGYNRAKIFFPVLHQAWPGQSLLTAMTQSAATWLLRRLSSRPLNISPLLCGGKKWIIVFLATIKPLHMPLPPPPTPPIRLCPGTETLKPSHFFARLLRAGATLACAPSDLPLRKKQNKKNAGGNRD